MIQEPQSMAQEWTEEEVMVHHAIIDFYDMYPSAPAESIDIAVIQECTGLSYDEVYEARERLERKGVISIEAGAISLRTDGRYHPQSVCLEEAWHTVLLRVKDLRERLRGLSLPQQTIRVHVRGRIGWWSTPTMQKALRTVEKYYQVKVTMRENLLFAQALLWQVAAAVEAVENLQETDASASASVPEPHRGASSVK